MKKASSKLAESVRQVTKKQDVPETSSSTLHEGKAEKPRKAVSPVSSGTQHDSHPQLQPTHVWPD